MITSLLQETIPLIMERETVSAFLGSPIALLA